MSDYTLDMIARAKWLSNMDLKSSHLQEVLHTDDK